MSPRNDFDSYQHLIDSGVNIDDPDEGADDVEKPRRRRRGSCEDAADGSSTSLSHWLLLSLVGLSCVVFGWTLRSVVSNERAAGRSPFPRDRGGATSSSARDIVWSDEFDGGSVDPSRWTLADGDGCSAGLCGWGNNELEFYSPASARVSGGRLKITAERYRTAPVGDPSYTSAKMATKSKAEFGLAGDEGKTRRFEASMKLPDGGNGVWPAFWMLPADDKYGGWPRSGEIDIMESIGKEGNTIHGTIHYGAWPQHQYSEHGLTFPGGQNLNETFHRYALERQRGEIRWFLDDIEYAHITSLSPYLWPFDEQFYFILNLAVGGNWPGNPTETTKFPQVLEVDYVRVYESVFPAIVGKTIVGCDESTVIYEVVNTRATKFDWTLPEYAAVTGGLGTSRIEVNFNASMVGEAIKDNEIIYVRSAGDELLQGEGERRLADGIGLRVKITDYEGNCSPEPDVKLYGFDCGRPSTCTQHVLHKTTEVYTCGERIQYLMEKGESEADACRQVAMVQFHGHCGGCNP